MKKLVLIICLVFAYTQTSSAQAKFGIKAGINYNSDSFEEVKDDVFSGAKSKTGFHAGVFVQAKIPALGLFLRPELVYTSLSNEVKYYNETATYDFQKLDIPVLLGTKVLKIGRVYGGPSFQYILDADFDTDDIRDVEADGFTVGLQFGAGVQLGRFGVDLRWERALSDTETKYFNGITNSESNFDTRVNQIIIGVSLEL